jgi:hypothetical protein
MKRVMAMLTVTVVLAMSAAMAGGADMKPIHTQKTKDVVVTLTSDSGQWKQGKNDFMLEITSAKDTQPVDAGRVSLNTSMTMQGMAPMISGATLSPGKAPGRYMGTINFPDGGTRQVVVTWDGPGGKGSTRFSVPVR